MDNKIGPTITQMRAALAAKDAEIAAAVREREEWNGKHQEACLEIERWTALANVREAISTQQGKQAGELLAEIAKLREVLSHASVALIEAEEVIDADDCVEVFLIVQSARRQTRLLLTAGEG